jgi:hypothetical protein
VRDPRPVNMDFGGGGRIYIVSSLISPLIVTVTVLLDYNAAAQPSDAVLDIFLPFILYLYTFYVPV